MTDKLTKRKKIIAVIGILLCVTLLVSVIACGTMLGINGYVMSIASDNFVTVDEAYALEDVDCILVLGCKVHDDGALSDMLEDRVKTGVMLYKEDVAPKIIMSGDHGTLEYDEVGAMKQYAIKEGVLSEDIFLDHAGFSTYESMYRAKEIFGVEKLVIVTQEYHLYRAVYIAEKLGMEAYGAPADIRTYRGQTSRDIRELLARCKDFATAALKPKPTYLGDKISLEGNGDITNG